MSNIDELFPKIEKKIDPINELKDNIKNQINQLLKDYNIRFTFDEYKRIIETYIKNYVFNVNTSALLEVANAMIEQ